MTFWAYMLQCADRHFYVGHTDDFERRLAEHQTGHFKGYTATGLPVHLVWSEQFQIRDETKAAEIRLKGWSRAKKLALIRGDWADIAQLARSEAGQRAP